MRNYLESSQYIDWQHAPVQLKAQQLAQGLSGQVNIARRCFEFVRDEIKHSADYQMNPVTCAASDVLKYGTGYCYAKSHLLAALLRANDIPAGLCYQRLLISDDQTGFCLHGLNALFLEGYGWYRIDARGNKSGVNAQFSPPQEQLAFAITTSGEADLPEIWSTPLPVIISALQPELTVTDVAENLPDIEVLSI